MYSSRIVLVGAFLASGVHADWLLSDYATPAADSAATEALYGIRSIHNPSSKVDVHVADRAVSLVASVIASDSTEGYSANVRLLHPLTPDWATYDISYLTSVDFEYRNSATITDYLSVSFGSEVYSDEIANAGTVYEFAISATTALAKGTTWKKGSAPAADFATPKWWTDIPATFPESIQVVLKKVKNLQFAPKTAYTGDGTKDGAECTKCTAPTMAKITLEIRKITLVGVPQGGISKPNREMVGCEEASTPVALDFAFDDNANEAGGYWFNFSDFDSTGTSTDKAKGQSTSSFTTVKAVDAFAWGSITLHAGLNKVNAGKWNPYAGWAAIGTGFEGAGWMIPTGLAAIKFRLQADPDSLVNIQYINFKVGLKGISDTATHLVKLPISDFATAEGDAYCIRPEDLKMPGYVAAADTVNFAEAMLDGIKQLAWEVKITDDKSEAIKTSQIKLTVSDVQLYGLTLNEDGSWPMVGVKGKALRPAARPFGIKYANGVLNLKGFDGVSSVDVLSINGRKVASFAPQATMALDLGRGTYFVSAKRNGATVVQSFAVVGR